MMFEENSPSMEAADTTIDQRIDAMIKMKDVNDKSFNAVNWQVGMDQIVEKSNKKGAKGLYALLTSPMVTTLEATIKDGSQSDSDVSSKDALNRLNDLGLMTTISEKGKKMNAVTLMGYQFYTLAGGKAEESKDDKDADKKDDKKSDDKKDEK
jgi:hypothetical protein